MTPDEQVEALDFIRRIVGAWDCCATCAGGVLLAHDKAVRTAALREAAEAIERTDLTCRVQRTCHVADATTLRMRADRETPCVYERVLRGDGTLNRWCSTHQMWRDESETSSAPNPEHQGLIHERPTP